MNFFKKIVVVCDETRKIINFLLNACIHDFDWYIYARHVCLFTLHYVYLSVIDELKRKRQKNYYK
jgi:hypothetical protein